MAAAAFSSSTRKRTGGAPASRSSSSSTRGSSGISVGAPSSMTTNRRTVVKVCTSGQKTPSSDRSTKITSSSPWLTTYVSWSGNSRMFSVCRTRPEHGTAQ